MSPDDPRHGHRAGYIAGCRDACCGIPHGRYQKRSKLRLLQEGTQIVDAVPTRQRVEWWRDRGVGLNAICQAAGLGYGTLAELAAGERDVCLRSTVRAVNATTWDNLPGTALCYADLTRRRIFSLMASGHRLEWIVERVGRGVTVKGGRWREQERVTIDVARAVARVAAEAPGFGPARQTASKARNRGHLPIAGWDDPGTPAEPKWWAPDTSATTLPDDGMVVECILAGDWRLKATHAQRLAVADRWVATGHPQNELERLTGWNVTRDRRLARQRQETAA